MTKKIPFIIIIILVIIVVALVIIFSGIKKEEEEAEESQPEKEEPIIAKEIYGLSGEIKETKAGALLVEAKILLADSGKEPIKEIIEIIISDETKIIKLKFPEEIPEGSIEPIFPEETEVGFDELKVGDKIDIKTAENVSENIKNKTEIEANVINIVE